MLFLAAYAATLILWPWEGTRLLYPIQPQLFFGFLVGVETALLVMPRLLRPAGFWTSLAVHLTTIVAVILILLSAVRVMQPDNSRVHAGDLEARTQWLRLNTPPSAIIVTSAAEIDFIYGGRKTMPYPYPATIETLDKYLTHNAVTHILVAPAIRYMQPVYIPEYDQFTTELLSVLADLRDLGKIAPVYDSGPDLIQVFEVKR
jgi:hypothetical protein